MQKQKKLRPQNYQFCGIFDSRYAKNLQLVVSLRPKQTAKNND
jgi:hypothetical protein